MNAALGIYAVSRRTSVTPLRGFSHVDASPALCSRVCCEPGLGAQAPRAGSSRRRAPRSGSVRGPRRRDLDRAGERGPQEPLWSTFAIAIACTARLVVLERARKEISLAHERVLTVTSHSSHSRACRRSLRSGPSPPRTRSDDLEARLRARCGVRPRGLRDACDALRSGTNGCRARRRLLTVGTGLVVLQVWLEGEAPLARAMGVVLIAFAAFAVSVPVLHWIDRGALAAAEATTAAVRFCPHCGGKLDGDVGVQVECGRCGREFTVTPS